jgi:hypothetical protein
MDLSTLRTGEKIAAAAGIILLLAMFILDWYTADFGPFGGEFGVNAFESFDIIDLILLLTVIAAIALAVTSMTGNTPDLPIAMSAIVAGLGILSTLLVLYRLINPPGEGGIDRGIGIFVGLVAAAGIAYGGWRAMQDEGTSFTAERDRMAGPGPGAGGPPAGGPPAGGPPAGGPPPTQPGV